MADKTKEIAVSAAFLALLILTFFSGTTPDDFQLTEIYQNYTVSELQWVTVTEEMTRCIDYNNLTDTCDETETYLLNKTKPIWNNVTHQKTVGYEFLGVELGECCAYYDPSPYEPKFKGQVISCKQKIKDICNPLIQFSMIGEEMVFEEYGDIYEITDKGIKVTTVGGYDYVDKLKIKVSQWEE